MFRALLRGDHDGDDLAVVVDWLWRRKNLSSCTWKPYQRTILPDAPVPSMWHEARRSERKVHDIMDAARKRAERRAVFLAKRRGDPHQQLKIAGTRCRLYHDQAMYQATEDQHGLIPWNGKNDNLIDRFDGRALLDFIREFDKARSRREKTEEEEELEELVNFERYRDLIKRRRRGFTDEQGLLDVDQELESRTKAPSDRQGVAKGTYSQVGFDYTQDASSEEDDEDDEDETCSEDSEDEETDCIGKDHGVQRFSWLTYMDKKNRIAEKRQKDSSKVDPSMRRLSRKERRRASQHDRDGDRDLGRSRLAYCDPYREVGSSPERNRHKRSRRCGRSRSTSPARARHSSSTRKSSIGKIEYITEFGGDTDGNTGRAISPPPSPPQVDKSNRQLTGGRILEALHSDPAASLGDWDRNHHKKEPKSSTSSALAKLSKPASAQKPQQGEAKETPQERLKRIMSKQLNKQIKKDAASEMLKKKEQERQRQEKLAETRRISHHGCSRSCSRSRSRSRSPVRLSDRSRSRSPERYGRSSPRNRGRY